MKFWLKLKAGQTPYDAVKGKKPGQYVCLNVAGRVCKVLTVTGPNLTDQSFADYVDVNKQLERAHDRGLLRHAKKFEGEYDDFPNFDYQEAQFQLARARSMFEELPAAMRFRFEGDPGKFMKFVNDPKNLDEMRELGMMTGVDGLTAAGRPSAMVPPAVEPPAVPPAEPPVEPPA